jgi:hypothetical protein
MRLWDALAERHDLGRLPFSGSSSICVRHSTGSNMPWNAFDHHEAVAAGIAKRHPQRRRHRLGARIGRSAPCRPSYPIISLGDRGFQLGRKRRTPPDLDPAPRRAVDALVAVTEMIDSAETEIDIAIAVDPTGMRPCRFT